MAALTGGILLATSILLAFVTWLVADERITTSNNEAPTISDHEGSVAGKPAERSIETRPLAVSSVSASSSYSPAFGPANLIDGDLATYWNDRSRHGEGAELTFEFPESVAIAEIIIHSVRDPTSFRRNHRIRGYVLVTDDIVAPVVGELQDTQEPQTIKLESVGTKSLTIRVTSTYEGEAVEDAPPFDELAIAEVVVHGVPAASQ